MKICAESQDFNGEMKSLKIARNQIIYIVLCMTQILPAIYGGQISPNKINRMSCRNEATFKANGTDFMVKEGSSKLNVTISASLLPYCARSCIKTSECKSVLYKRMPGTPAEKNCQILNVEKNDLTSDDIQSSTGWIYYEPLHQGTSRCQKTTCLPGYLCVETCDLSALILYNCIDINECESNPCKNGATCSNNINSYSCTCAPGYTGVNCEIDINECSSSPCKIGATCNDQINSYSCTCAPGYTGATCDTDINECSSSPCKSGATCNNQLNYYTCTCAPGYTGANCDTDINECGSNPCPSTATCHDYVNSYRCACPSGYLGPNCDRGYTNSFASQNYPSNYPNSHSYSWLFSVSSGRVVLYFRDFKTEGCCDKVVLRDGSSSSSPILATVGYTEGLYKNYIASGNYMHVTFTTDGSVTYSGFAGYIGSL